jgi:hypothetical protein
MNKTSFEKAARALLIADALKAHHRTGIAKAAVAKVAAMAEQGFMPQHTQEQYIAPSFMQAMSKANAPAQAPLGKPTRVPGAPPAKPVPMQAPKPPMQAPAQTMAPVTGR